MEIIYRNKPKGMQYGLNFNSTYNVVNISGNLKQKFSRDGIFKFDYSLQTFLFFSFVLSFSFCVSI